MQLPVIGAGVEQALLQLGLGDVGDGSERDIAAPFRAWVRCQIRANASPLVAPVLALEYVVGACVERLRIVVRQDEGGHPVGPQSLAVRRRAGLDAALLARLQIPSLHRTEKAFSIHRIQVVRVDPCDVVVPAVVPVPVLFAQGHGLRLAAEDAVVLRASPYLVRLAGIYRDRIELGERQCIHVEPDFASIVRDVEPAIGGEDDPVGIICINEHVVIVTMRRVPISLIRKHGDCALGDTRLGLTGVG